MTSSDPSDSNGTAADPPSTPDRSALEAHLKHLWQEMLQIPEIGATESFPALGGDSLTAMRMLSEVARVWGVSIALGEFYRADTINSLAALIVARRASPADTNDAGLAEVGSGEI
jgi:acyl carrier protein